MADGRTRTISTKGISIRRVATMHQVPFSKLQRAIASWGLSALKTRPEAHEAEMILTIAEEAALEECCLHMHRWGFPIRSDILHEMATAMIEDRERRNMGDASYFFDRILDAATVLSKERDGNYCSES